MQTPSSEALLATCNAINVTPGALIVGTICTIAIVVTIHLLALAMPRERNFHAQDPR